MSGTNESIRILFVDDDPDIVDVAATFLEREDERFKVETASDAREGESKLAEEPFDCIISDYEMPGPNGVEFLENVRGDDPDLPFILYTGRGSEEVASEAISAGVTDYLQKEVGTSQYEVLSNRVDNAVAARRAEREREATKDRLATQNRALRRLNEISAARDLSFDEKIRQILELGRTYLGTETGFLSRVDCEKRQWEVIESSGTDERVSPGTTVPLSETYCRQVLETDGVFELTRADEQGWSGDPAFERWGYQTYIGASIRVDGDDYGTLCFADRSGRDRPFDETDRTFVDLTSHWISAELERHLHERELQRHSKYTDDLLDALEDTFYVVGHDGALLRWNESVATVTGYSDEEIGQMHALDFFPEDVADDIAETIQEVFETGSTQIEAPYLTKDGKRLPYELTAVRVTSPDDEMNAVGTGRDISNRKQREQALERERERLDTLFQHLPNPVVRGVLKGTEAYVLDVNQAFEETFGYEADAIIGERLHDLVLPEGPEGPDRKERAEKLVRQLHEKGGLHTEVRRQTAQGPRDFRLDVTVEVTDADNPEGYAVYTDITEQRERERRTERRYEAIFNHSYQFTGLLEPDGTLIEANQAALEVGNLGKEEVIGKPFWETYWWQVDDQTRHRIRDAIERTADGEFVRFETRHRSPDGPIVVDFSIRPVTDEDGEVLYLLPEGRNITELKTLKQRERALERQNERLDEFASVLSHDLRSPLNVAVSNLELARREYESDALEAVARSQERMKTLIEDVLSLARGGKAVTSTEPVDLAELFETVGYYMELDEADLVSETDRVIRADRRRLYRLLENLLRNAVEHGGDEVTVTIGDLPDGFYVADDGPGLPEELREKIFETGYSTTDTGTGFGLSIAREIAEAHDWSIRATESTEGGARFEITGVECL